MQTSQEILSVPDVTRKIQIWIYSNEDSSFLVNWTGNEQIFCIDTNSEHRPFVVAHGNENNSIITIKCLTGQVYIGSIEINYSWCINPYFTNKYSQQVQRFLDSGCNLNVIDSSFLNDLMTTDFFLSTGENNFSPASQLISNVHINNQKCNIESWYCLNHNDIFTANIYVTTPASVVKQTVPIKNTFSKPVQKYNYDAEFISKLDTRFYEFVNKKLSDKNFCWEEHNFTGYRIPYSDAMRIQTQLVDNVELIKDKHVVDLGTYRGKFLYPCIDLGCKSVTGVQPLEDYNNVINQGLSNLNYNNRASAIWGDAYNLNELTEILKGKDTLLMLGLLYHLNNHYQLLEAITKTNISGLVIDIFIAFWLDHYIDPTPSIKWFIEQQNVDKNGWELNGVDKNQTWVGCPNASWIIQTLQFLGWNIKSNIMHSNLRTTSPQLTHRGVITAYR